MGTSARAGQAGTQILQHVGAAELGQAVGEHTLPAKKDAELLYGKQINLEKARLYALTGDYEGLTREINKNVGDFNDFSNMNVLQQEKLAQAGYAKTIIK